MKEAQQLMVSFHMKNGVLHLSGFKVQFTKWKMAVPIAQCSMLVKFCFRPIERAATYPNCPSNQMVQNIFIPTRSMESKEEKFL